MSISDLRRDAVTARKCLKRDILGRHKEVLTEIFYFTKNPDIPPDSELLVEQALAESSDLKEFLLGNDLESGHVFQESTLPTLQTVAVNASAPPVPDVNGAGTKLPPQTPVTPQSANNLSSLPPQPPSSGSGRMVTRVSSGAIRHKSVGELLGERDFAPKHTQTRSNDFHRDSAAIEALVAGYPDPSSLQKTPNPPSGRTRGALFQDFSTTTPPSNRVEFDRLQAAAEIFPLDHFVSKAQKSVRTSDWTKAVEEKKTIAICNRISELKDQGLWSLRQPVKQKVPSRPNAHWDYLLKEMEWMSTDFYEERKFKMAGAFLISKAVQEYHESMNRESLIHKWPRRLRTPVKHFEEEADADEDVLMVAHRGSASPISMDHDAEPMREIERSAPNGDVDLTTPMLVDPPQEPAEPMPDALPTPPSSCELDDLPAIFDLPSDVIYASVNELPKKDGSSLSQLPLYGPPTLTDEPYRNSIDDLPIVPISKFCLERYVVPITEWEPRNRNYRQSTPEHPDDMLDVSREVQVEAIPSFAPARTEPAQAPRRRSSALVIRPPAPPNHWNDQKPSPWTPEEERMLLQSSKDNHYNFDLVASSLAFSASSVSDLERRSAWECFEKFRSIYPEPQNIQLAGPNSKLAMQRLASRVSMSSRPRPNPIHRQARLDVRNHRYLNLFDAMKKSAKNREKSKAQEKAPVKKPKDNLPTKAAVNVPTPLDLARVKFDRDRAFNQAMIAERQAQAIRFQMPANATPEQQEELRRHLLAQQQQAALMNAQGGGQGLRQNPGLGRGLVIPGGPNARPMPIRPNTGPNAMPGPLRLPNGVTATPEQMQQIFKARQLAALQQAAGVQNGVPQTPQQMQRFRALQQAQQAQLNAAAQNAVQNNAANGVADYIPFNIAQANGAAVQAASQVGNLGQNNRLMQPPQNGAVAQGVRQGTPQQQLQLPLQAGQNLRATPPRPANLSPTAQTFSANLQTMVTLVQQNNPQLSLQDAQKLAVELVTRQQASGNGLMQQHLQQQLAKSSPTQQNQQIRRSPSQNAQGQQRMS